MAAKSRREPTELPPGFRAEFDDFMEEIIELVENEEMTIEEVLQMMEAAINAPGYRIEPELRRQFAKALSARTGKPLYED
jgi:hypothetical protein